LQVNTVNLDSTSFGKKENKYKKDCPSCNPNTDNSMVHIPRWFYRGLLATALAAPLLTSCEPMNPPDDPTKNINITNPNNPTVTPSTYVTPIDPVVPAVPITTAASRHSEMWKPFGIATKTASLPASEGIKNGDIIEFGYQDGNDLYKFAINQELTTADKVVYYGTSKDLETGQIVYHCHIVTPTKDGEIVEKKTTKFGKPPSENSSWNDAGTYHNVKTPTGYEEYKIYSDGSEHLQYTYKPKNETTIFMVTPSGGGHDLTDVSVTELKNTDTGLHDVHM